jgi:hypothetical protein
MASTLLLLVLSKDGNCVEHGDPVGVGHDGGMVRLDYADRAQVPGKSGKVVVTYPDGSRGYYYDHVFGLTVHGILCCGCDHYTVWEHGHRVACPEYDGNQPMYGAGSR